ncbi:hypothetical protein K7432_015389 [Basidiobolus ranarum]|uniref:Uncharacterized protein n=1 Tax=Basidiobolus ranarum TaxID=34480 RepID=A0ABR2WG70_9FUNG
MQESQILYRNPRPQAYDYDELQGEGSVATSRSTSNIRNRRNFEETQFDVFGHIKHSNYHNLGRKSLHRREPHTNSSSPVRLTTRTNDNYNNTLSTEYSRVLVNNNSFPTSKPKFGVVMDVFSVLMIVTVGFVMVF